MTFRRAAFPHAERCVQYGNGGGDRAAYCEHLVAMETKPISACGSKAARETFIYKEAKAGAHEDVQNADIIPSAASPEAPLSAADKLKWLQTKQCGRERAHIHGCLPRRTVLTNATGLACDFKEYMVAVWPELLKKLHLYRDVQRARGKWCDLGQGALGVELDGAGARPPATSVGIAEAYESALGAKEDRRAPTGTWISPILWTSSSPISLKRIFATGGLRSHHAARARTATKGMFDAERMAKASGDGAILLNVGRGMIVRHRMCCARRWKTSFAGAGVDRPTGPLSQDRPLYGRWKCDSSPHLDGYHLQETHDHGVRIMAENLKRCLAGGSARNMVDFRPATETMRMMDTTQEIYLDNSATTRVSKAAEKGATRDDGMLRRSPSSLHGKGFAAEEKGLRHAGDYAKETFKTARRFISRQQLPRRISLCDFGCSARGGARNAKIERRRSSIRRYSIRWHNEKEGFEGRVCAAEADRGCAIFEKVMQPLVLKTILVTA